MTPAARRLRLRPAAYEGGCHRMPRSALMPRRACFPVLDDPSALFSNDPQRSAVRTISGPVASLTVHTMRPFSPAGRQLVAGRPRMSRTHADQV